MFSPVSELVGWLRQLLFLFEGFWTSHIPLEYFLPQWKSHRMAFNMAPSSSLLEVVPTCPNLSFFFLSLYFFHLLFSKKHLDVIDSSCFLQFLGWLGGCVSYFFYSRGSGHLTYPWNTFFPSGNPTEWRSTWLPPAPSWKWSQRVPTCHFSFFLSISSIFCSARSIWMSLILHVFSSFWAGWVVASATFLFEGFRTSHIPLEYFLPQWKSHRMAFNMAPSSSLLEVVPTCPNLSFFLLSLYFFHLLFSKKHLDVIDSSCFLQFLGWLGGCGSYFFYSRGSGHLTYPWNTFFPSGNPTEWRSTWLPPAPSWKWSQRVPTCHFSFFLSISSIFCSARSIWMSLILHVFSSFWAGWVVASATFLFEGFRTSHIPLEYFRPQWKSHRMAFNMAPSSSLLEVVPTCPNLSFFFLSLYFFHLLFSKKHLDVIDSSCFLQFLGWLGGCGSYFFIRGVPDISHTPGILSSPVEIPQNGVQHGSLQLPPGSGPNVSQPVIFLSFSLFLPSSVQQEAFGCH